MFIALEVILKTAERPTMMMYLLSRTYHLTHHEALHVNGCACYACSYRYVSRSSC